MGKRAKTTTAPRAERPHGLDWLVPLSPPPQLSDRMFTRDRHDAADLRTTERGFQAACVERALKRLKLAGVQLSGHTRQELRRVILKQIRSDGEAKKAGFPEPTRSTLDRVIKRHLNK